MARTVSSSIDSLPHWARVAFAARSSRSVLCLFEMNWPDAAPNRIEPLTLAITLAERSAENGTPASGLHDAIVSATTTAGAALIAMYGFEHETTDEPRPQGELACQIASFVAKSAEHTAKAASSCPDESAEACLEAFAWACEASELAKAGHIISRINRDFENVLRTAKSGRWNDTTPVPSSVFDLLADDPPDKPFWAFWR